MLDSPVENAISHYLNVTLFLLGPTPYEAATVESVEAELYRARPIDNYDTISMRLTLAGGCSVVVLMTHACATQVNARVQIHAAAARCA